MGEPPKDNLWNVSARDIFTRAMLTLMVCTTLAPPAMAVGAATRAAVRGDLSPKNVQELGKKFGAMLQKQLSAFGAKPPTATAAPLPTAPDSASEIHIHETFASAEPDINLMCNERTPALKTAAVVAANGKETLLKAGNYTDKVPLWSLRIMLATVLAYKDSTINQSWQKTQLQPLLQSTQEPNWGPVQIKLGGPAGMMKRAKALDPSFDLTYDPNQGVFLANAEQLTRFIAIQLNSLTPEQQTEIFTALATRQNEPGGDGTRLNFVRKFIRPTGGFWADVIGNGDPNTAKTKPYAQHDLVLVREIPDPSNPDPKKRAGGITVITFLNEGRTGESQTLDKISSAINGLELESLTRILEANDTDFGWKQPLPKPAPTPPPPTPTPKPEPKPASKAPAK
jgi:hypothetical protein